MWLGLGLGLMNARVRVTCGQGGTCGTKMHVVQPVHVVQLVHVVSVSFRVRYGPPCIYIWYKDAFATASTCGTAGTCGTVGTCGLGLLLGLYVFQLVHVIQRYMFFSQ